MPPPVALTIALALLGQESDDPIDHPAPLAWPSGPLEVRIAYDRPIAEDAAARVEGRSIAIGPSGGGATGPEPGEALGALRIAGARRVDGGRTLSLLTDPHPTSAAYVPDLPDGLGRPSYDLSGVEASWTAEGEREAAWTGWLPDLDLGRSRRLVAVSAEHDQAFERMRDPGTLTLRTLLDLPEGEVPVAVESDRPFEAELAYLPLEVGPDHRAEGVAESFGEPTELFLTLPTGGGLPDLRVSFRLEEDENERPLSLARQLLPWAPAPIASAGDAPPLPPELLGGDPARGEAVFFGEQGKCADCHRVGDRGGAIGPDLSDVGERLDPAAIHQAIAAPSDAIAPEYLPYTVAMRDGRVFVGVVRAEGAEAIRVVGSDAEAVDLPRAEVEELRPVATSIMPVGLAGALGRRDLSDLIAYLSGLQGD